MGLSFFGLTLESSSQAKISIYRQIHQICFHGKGGYGWHDVYNMSIWLRRFIFSEIKTYYSEEKKTQESQTQPNTKTVIDSDGKVKSPEHLKHVKKPIKYN